MKLLRDIRIGIKVLIPPMIVILVLAIVSLLAIYGLEQQRRALSAVNDIALEQMTLVEEFVALSEHVQSDVFRIAVLQFMDMPDEEVQPILTHLEQGVSDLDVIYGQILSRWPLDKTEEERLERMKGPLDDFAAQAQQAVAVVSDDPAFGVLLVRSSAVSFSEFRDTLSEFRAYQQAKIVRTETEANQKAQLVRVTIIALAFSIALIGVLTTVTISTRWISRPIRSMTDLMQRLAAGDLSVTIGDSERQDEIGAMVRAVAVFRDNAVEKQVAEEALRAEKERAQQYLDIAGVVLVALDVNGNITLVNRKGLELLGYEETELMGRNWFETCLPEPLRKDVQSVFVELMAGKVEQAEYHENLVLTKSGEERIIAWRNALLRNADGKITGTLSSGEDITERVRLETIRAQAEAALITVHERMEDAQQVAKIGNWELSLADMTLEWSEEVFRIFGLDPSSTEPSIDAFWDSVHPDDRMMVQERSTQHLTSFGQDARYTYRIQLPDGTIKHLEHTGRQRCDDEGNILSVYGTIQDVTERAQADEALRESHRRLEETLSELRETQDKMVQQERLAAVGQLAGGIAHDFNNLLTAIMLYAHMPLSEPDLSPELKRSFETIFDESRHAADLVQQILDFSRRSPLHTQPFDLRPFVKEAIRMLERTIPESIHIHVEAGQETYAIDADATRIQQVLMNLALNARDAMPDGGELRIGLAHASVQPDEIPPIPEMAPGKWVCLTVSDTGSGIPLTARPHIFEPFFTTKAVGEGTGLGLAQVYGIVKQHGGHIDYETEMGEGTAFHVYLPAHQSSVEAAAGEAEFDIPVGSGETILLVEDEEQIRLGGQAVLESLGYRVLTAEDGQAALEILQTEEKVDLVITDVVMPRMGGKSLLQELRKMTPDLKTLAITGYVAQQDIAALRQDGFTGIIHKPFDMDTLASMVRQVLDAG